MRALATALAEIVDTKVKEATSAVQTTRAEALVPHSQWEAAPPDETPAERRKRLRRWSDRARAGGVPGARQRGRTWYLTTAQLAEYMRTQHAAPLETLAERRYRERWQRKQERAAQRRAARARPPIVAPTSGA